MKNLMQILKSISIITLLAMFTQPSIAQTYFQITTSAENTAAHITTIDHSSTNNKPNEIIVVTPVYGKYVNAPIGVWYNQGKWKIYTEDRSAIPMGTKFNVMAAPQSLGAKRIKMPAITNNNELILKGLKKNDIVLVTHVFGEGRYNESPVSANLKNGAWILSNELDVRIPTGMEFNIIVPNKFKTGDAFIHRTNDRPMSHVSAITKTSGADKDKLVFATPNKMGSSNKGNTGIWWYNNKWNVFNQGRENMQKDVAFNVFVVEPTPFIIFVPPILLPPVLTGNTEEQSPPGVVRTKANVILPFHTVRQAVKYVNYRGKSIYQGDIVLGNSTEVVAPRPNPHPKRPDFVAKYDNNNYGTISSQSSAITAVGTDYNQDWGESLWNFGVIPYQIGSQFTADERNSIVAALNYLDENSNLTLKPRNGDSDYIFFGKNFSDGIGWSPVGRQGGGQEIMLGGLSKGHIVHEVLHSAGFWHEQSRPDRDNHVEIIWDNIDSEFSYNFDKHLDARPLGPYDYNSIMHYGAGAFGDGETTIRRRSGSGSVGRGDDLTGIDIDGINILYDLDAVTLVTPPLNSTRRIDATIKRFEAKSGSDGCGEVEFYADIAIKGGHTWRAWSNAGDLRRRTSEIEGRLFAPRDWKHSAGVDPNLDHAKVVVRMKEADSGFCFADDWVDINPLNGLMELQLMVNLINGEIYIWDQERNRRADYVGQANSDIPLQGFETRDHDNDEAIPGHILIRIDVVNP